MKDTRLNLTDFFTIEDIIPHCGDSTRDDIIRALVAKLAARHKFNNAKAIEDQVLARESDGSTVITDGLSVPHARLSEITQPYAAVATSERGIRFPGEETSIHLVFLLLIPQDRPALYLQILRALATALRDETVLRTVAAMTNAGEIFRFFQSGKAYLPRYITAADIMAREFITLKDTDTLQTCVDTFIRNNVSEIPILDRDGDLSGVVRAGELLRICLPEYLLWMNDLTPIANFEPFAEVLQNECRTWLSDILVKDFPCVTPDAPAISVAGEMTRYKSSRCYVREGNKLVGLIRLPRFLNKIFRE